MAPSFAAAHVSPAIGIAIALLVLLALVLLIWARLSARRSAGLRPAPPPPPKPLPSSSSAAVERTPISPPPPLPPKPVREESIPSLEERRLRKEREEAEKRAAYRARKEQEAEEREARRQAEEDRLAREAEEARRTQEEAARRAAEETAERERKIQAEAGRTLAEGLAKTRRGLFGRLNGLLGGESQQLDEGKLLGELEELLFSADIGVKTASQLLEVARQRLKRGERGDLERIRTALREEIQRILEANAPAEKASGGPRPEVWMIVGVNGSGKTTTVGKMAAQLANQGQSVVLAAADTFRAAATEQLAIWAQRAKAELVRGPEGSDPGSVAFESVRRGIELGADRVLIDTAGRLHTKTPLMEELKKVKRVLEKARAGAPDEVLLVLDATNGQNAIAQARQFHESLGITGIALTKLDGTAKGGVIIGISEELHLPVRYIGIGEGVNDLRPFEVEPFVEALFA